METYSLETVVSGLKKKEKWKFFVTNCVLLKTLHFWRLAFFSQVSHDHRKEMRLDSEKNNVAIFNNFQIFVCRSTIHFSELAQVTITWSRHKNIGSWNKARGYKSLDQSSCHLTSTNEPNLGRRLRVTHLPCFKTKKEKFWWILDSWRRYIATKTCWVTSLLRCRDRN